MNRNVSIFIVVIAVAISGWGVIKFAHRECWFCDKDDFFDRGVEFACSEYPAYKSNSIKFIKQAAEQGNVEAAFFLAELYLGDLNGTEIVCLRELAPVSQEKAVNEFKVLESLLEKEAAPPASICARLGLLYYNGTIDSESPVKSAIKWFLKAAKMGNPFAMEALANIYDSKDEYQKALEWYTKASEDKIRTKSALAVGDYYFYGKGVDIDYQKARSWYVRALNMIKAISSELSEDKRKKAYDPAAVRIEITDRKISEAGGETPLVISYRLEGGSAIYQVYSHEKPEMKIGKVEDINGTITATVDEAVALNPDVTRSKSGFSFMNQGLEWLLNTFSAGKHGENRLYIFKVIE